MAKLKFEEVSYAMWWDGDPSGKFTMYRNYNNPPPRWKVKEESSGVGAEVCHGDTTRKAKASLAKRLGVGEDKIRQKIRVYKCWKDSELAYEIRVEGRGCQVYDSTGNPVSNAAFDTYTEARSWCVNKA